MSHPTDNASRLAITGLYLFAALLVFWPILDLVTTSWPPQFGTLQWRYGMMGLLASYTHTPILGLVLAMIAAFGLRHTGVLRTVSVLSLLGGLVLLIVLVMFPLDVVQMGSNAPPEARPSMKAGAIIAELKHGTGFLALVLLGLGGWRTAGYLSKGPEARSHGESAKRTGDLVKRPDRPRED